MKLTAVSGILVLSTLALSACAPQPIALEEFCDRRQFTRAEIAALQARPDYAEILRRLSDECPQVALFLTEAPTATITPPGGGDGGGNGGGGPSTPGPTPDPDPETPEEPQGPQDPPREEFPR